MDSNFLELFGNLLIGTAQGKKQVEDMIKWTQKGFSDLSSSNKDYDLPTMFKKFYGLENVSERSAEYKKMAEKAVKDFQGSLKEYFNMLGMVPKNEKMVPKNDYLDLVRKYEKLKEKCENQEETIRHLRLLSGEDHGNFMDGFQDIVKGQAEIFQNMMKGFGNYLAQKENKTPVDKQDSK